MSESSQYSESDSEALTVEKINGVGGAEKSKKNFKTLHLNVPHPIKLKNYQEGVERYDVFHAQAGELSGGMKTKCSEKVCNSSIMDVPGRGNTPKTPSEVAKEAEAFIKQYYESIGRDNSDAHKARLQAVKKEIKQTGTYQLLTSELVYGAKLAWRNAPRCIGRIQWKKLQMFDCREVTTATGMYEALCNHIKYATNKGNVRSAITVFPQRTDGKHDYRIWNSQIIIYAGYRMPDGSVMGDPARVEFTDVCIKLGWKPPRTHWDILPLVLSANGRDPELFEVPKDIIMQVDLEHPHYDWFKDLGLKWYVTPAVTDMSLDCGGLEFTAVAFNGWYMCTEIGSRNLCDITRRNLAPLIASKMGLDTNSNSSLWKDRVLVEMNAAVLYSFHRDNASIVDHHSASEQFIKHLDNENKTRGGCPSDWIWIVPPMSASLTSVFHQEMSLYYIRPSYNHQEPPWLSYKWPEIDDTKPRRKFHFKQIARAVKFATIMYSKALAKRIKATILYATETGKSEQFAKELGRIFDYAFNVQVICMADYDKFAIEHETLLLVVTSTFGNGEPPLNGVGFVEHLFRMLFEENISREEVAADSGNKRTHTPKSLMRTNSLMSPKKEQISKMPLSRLESNKSSILSSVEHLGPLSSVCFAVFGLGSSAYPKFSNCAFTVDRLLHDLGGERILDIHTGDELYGQEQEFRKWSSKIFQVSCEQFSLDENDNVMNGRNAVGTVPLSEESVKFSKTKATLSLKTILEKGHKKPLTSCKVNENKILGDVDADRATIFISMHPEHEIQYEPGDHVAVAPCNRKEIVDAILGRLKDAEEFDTPVQLQVMKEILSPTGVVKSWQNHERIPSVSIRTMFTRLLNITTPPSTTILKYLAHVCSNPEEKEQLMKLVTDSNEYDEWRHFYYPHLAEVLRQFPSCRPQGSLLAVLLPPLFPRFYSISSSSLAHPKHIQLTVSVVTYKSQNGTGPTRYGVCSNYLKDLKVGEEIFLYWRRAPSFHLPADATVPIIMVGPGSGVAPLRGFWHHRSYQIKHQRHGKPKPGPMWLFFGCRNKGMDLYREEKQEALAIGALTKNFVALSREPGEKKTYVQQLIEEQGGEICEILMKNGGHFYICGDCKMAEEVQDTLRKVFAQYANLTTADVDRLIITLMDENRYHEDIFGITLRTGEVQKISRETAKRNKTESESKQQ